MKIKKPQQWMKTIDVGTYGARLVFNSRELNTMLKLGRAFSKLGLMDCWWTAGVIVKKSNCKRGVVEECEHSPFFIPWSRGWRAGKRGRR